MSDSARGFCRFLQKPHPAGGVGDARSPRCRYAQGLKELFVAPWRGQRVVHARLAAQGLGGGVMSRDRQIAVLASIVGLAGLVIGIVALSQNSGADDEWVRNRALPGDSKATSAAASASESDEREVRELSDRLERLEERQVADSQESTDDSSDETAEDREAASTDRDDSDLGAAQSAAPEEAEDRDGVLFEYDAEDPAGNPAEQETFEMELDEETTASATTTLPPTTTPPATTTAPPADGAANSSGGKKWKVYQDCNGDGIYEWKNVEDIEIDDCDDIDIDSVSLWDGSYDSSCSSFWESHQYGCVTTP